MLSRFVLELGDTVTGLDEHIGSSGERNGVIAADQLFDELADPRADPVPIGSNQLSNRCTAVSASCCGESDFVLTFIMAWSPVRRSNAG